MKILLIHNFYQYSGGEDEAFRTEGIILENHGHQVLRYTKCYDDIVNTGFFRLAIKTIWNQEVYRELRNLLQKEKPQIIHVLNAFPLISPSVYYAAKAENIPIVQSLHNPRLMCLSANFFRKGRLCTKCFKRKIPWHGIIHKCYRNSMIYSAGVASINIIHYVLKTWTKVVTGYISATEFYTQMFIEAGLPKEKIFIKPHTLYPVPDYSEKKGDYALFIGRLDPEKGIRTLINAWEVLKRKGLTVPLKIRGKCRNLNEISQEILKNNLSSVEFIERLERKALIKLIQNARFLVWPSEGYYETFGLVAIEAYSCGRPVISSNIGVMAENVKDGYTGLHFRTKDPEDLAVKIEWMWTHPLELEQMRKNARLEFEEKYSTEKNYKLLMNIYEDVIKHYKE